MTYKEIFRKKYKEGLSTQELVQRYPGAIRQVTDVALLDIPEQTLKEIVSEEEDLLRLMKLKKKYSNFF